MARIKTEIIVDIETLEVISEKSYEHSGPIALCKGGESKKAAEAARQQTAMTNAISAQNFGLGQQQLGMQQGQLNKVNAAIDPILANGGLSPEAEAAMRSIAMNTLPQTYNNLFGSLNNRLVQRGVTGGGMAGSGDIQRNYGALGAEMAGQQSNLLSQIPLQKEAGMYNALSAAMGVGNQYGSNTNLFTGAGLGALGASNQSLGTQQQAAQAKDMSGSAFWGPIFGGLGAIGGGLAQKKW